MKLKIRTWPVIFVCIILLAGVIAIRSDHIFNWVLARELRLEPEPKRRIVLMNISTAHEPAFWNSVYLREAERADTAIERRFLADLIISRFGTNAVEELARLFERQGFGSPKDNLRAVIKETEAAQPLRNEK